MTKLMEWYGQTVGDASVNAVAMKAGVVQTTLSRQIKAGALSPEVVAAVARAYGADVLDALVVAGVITEEDIRTHGARQALANALDVEIAREVARRLGAHPMLDAPLT